MPEKTQKTPQGAEIPIPKRGAFERILDKVAKKPAPPKAKRSTPKRRPSK